MNNLESVQFHCEPLEYQGSPIHTSEALTQYFLDKVLLVSMFIY